eukprot:gene1319-7_t
MTTNISDTIANVEELNNLYTKSSGAVREIKYQTVEPKDVILRLQQSLTDAPSSIEDALNTASSSLNTIRISVADLSNNLPEFKVENYLHDVKQIDKYRSMAELGIMALGVSMGFYVILAIWCRSMCNVGIAFILTILLVVIVACCVGGQSAASVAISDMCMKPTTFLLYQTAPNNTYISYYLFCEQPFPAEASVNQTIFEATRAVSAANVVLNYTKSSAPSSVTDAQQLAADFESLVYHLNYAFGAITCKNFWSQYQHIVQNACGNIILNMTLLAGAQLLACTLILFVLFCFPTVITYFGLHRLDLLLNGDPRDNSEQSPLINSEEQYTRSTPQVNSRSYSTLSSSTTANEPSDENETLTCKICWNEQIAIRLNCGHCICSTCVRNVNKCPWCRVHIVSQDQLILL